MARKKVAGGSRKISLDDFIPWTRGAQYMYVQYVSYHELKNIYDHEAHIRGGPKDTEIRGNL